MHCPHLLQACWDDNFNGRHIFKQTDFLHSPLLDELKALETRVLAEFAVVVPSALVVDRYVQAVLPCANRLSSIYQHVHPYCITS